MPGEYPDKLIVSSLKFLDIDDMLDSIDAKLSPVVSEYRAQDETVAHECIIALGNKRFVDVVCEADTATTFTIIGSLDSKTEDYTLYESEVAETEVRKTFEVGFPYLIVRSAAAGVAGDTVSILVSAK